MKIKSVVINNWYAPGKEWWDRVIERQDEPLIEATMTIQLSHREYHKLLDEEKASQEYKDKYAKITSNR